MRSIWRRLVGAMVLSGTLGLATDAWAAEGGVSFWVPGQAGPEAGILPPPGVYFDTTGYFYSASIGANRVTRLGGNVVANVKVDLKADFVTGLWVTPWEIFGGNVAFAVVLPWGDPAIRAGVLLNGPLVNRLRGRPLAVGARDSGITVGDPIVSTSIGWHAGNWNWKLSSAFNIPAGAYQPGELSNLAPNRFIADVAGAVSYFDPIAGIDLTGVVGFTFNGENPATQYRTGTEFHVDGSATKFLTKEFAVSAIVSHYEQLTRDSGPGATIGPFKGRVTAVGGAASYTFKLGDVPVATNVKVLQEVEVKNRFQGTITLLEIAFPLWVAPLSSKPMIAKH